MDHVALAVFQNGFESPRHASSGFRSNRYRPSAFEEDVCAREQASHAIVVQSQTGQVHHVDLIEVAYAFGVGLATRKTNTTWFV